MNQQNLESIVMEKLLSGSSDLLYQLRCQYRLAKVERREMTGVGFFTTFSLPSSVRCQIIANGTIDDVKAVFTDSKEEYYFILYITDGKIDTLEGVSSLFEWDISDKNFEIIYCYENKREYDLEIQDDTMDRNCKNPTQKI